MSDSRCNVAILGDSRAFDTYYTSSAYAVRYGYDRTFPALMRRDALADPACDFDVLHIPDHFRGGTVENNIIRLALTDPAAVVVLDGIWETLINKGHFLEYVERSLREHPTRSDRTLDLAYSSRALADLFLANKLSVSPGGYAERQRRLISYFRRRRRHCVWMSLPVTPPDHLDGLHYAGNYRCIPEWGECLRAVNDAVLPIAESYGAQVLDLDALMRKSGGAERCLIDQWHFTPAFHALIAERLGGMLRALVPTAPDARHVSHRYMPAGPIEPASMVAFGGAAPGIEAPQVGEAELASTDAAVVVLACAPEARAEVEPPLIDRLPPEKILVYPEEVGDIVNPRGDERAAFQDSGRHG